MSELAAVVERTRAAASAFMLAWLEEEPGVRLTDLGDGVVAASDAARPDLDFTNRVYGIRGSAAVRLPAVAEHYRMLGSRGFLELYGPDQELSEQVAACWEPLAPLAAFAGSPRTPVADDPRVERSLDGPLVSRLLRGGHGAPTAGPSGIAALADHPDAQLYLARLGGDPSAAAVLFRHGPTACLANASTLPAGRGRGLQSALIARRIADASALGCDLIVALAEPGTASARNLIRAGLAEVATVGQFRLRELPGGG